MWGICNTHTHSKKGYCHHQCINDDIKVTSNVQNNLRFRCRNCSSTSCGVLLPQTLSQLGVSPSQQTLRASSPPPAAHIPSTVSKWALNEVHPCNRVPWHASLPGSAQTATPATDVLVHAAQHGRLRAVPQHQAPPLHPPAPQGSTATPLWSAVCCCGHRSTHRGTQRGTQMKLLLGDDDAGIHNKADNVPRTTSNCIRQSTQEVCSWCHGPTSSCAPLQLKHSHARTQQQCTW